MARLRRISCWLSWAVCCALCALPRPCWPRPASFVATGPGLFLLPFAGHKPVGDLRSRHVACVRARKKSKLTLEPFAFEADLEDHCETPTGAFRDIKPLLLEIAARLYPSETDRRKPSRLLRIYDPFFCLGGTKKKLNKLGFESVYNRNEDFYAAIANSTVPEFDVLVTNPPYSEDRHLAETLRFALARRKPWLMLLQLKSLWRDTYTECLAHMDDGTLPFYIRPKKKYNFKTPAPLPPPPTEFRALARKRCRKVDTLWCIHCGEDAELRLRLMDVAGQAAPRAFSVVPDLTEMPRDLAPRKFSVEMQRNAELQNYDYTS